MHKYITGHTSYRQGTRIKKWLTGYNPQRKDLKGGLCYNDEMLSRDMNTALQAALWHDVIRDVQLIIGILDMNGDIIYVNDEMTHISGYKRGQLLGKHWYDFMPEDYHSHAEDLKKIPQVILSRT